MTEQIDKITVIDEALKFVAPEIVAESESPERVLMALKLSQLALSAYHPDRSNLDVPEYTRLMGIDALTKVNTLVKNFEIDESLPDLFCSTSNYIVGDSSKRIKAENRLTENTRLIREQITVKPEYLDGLSKELVSTGEVIDAPVNQKLLAMILGRNAISLLAKTDSTSLSGIMPLVKKKFIKETNNPFGIESVEWSRMFDEIEAVGSIDQSQLQINADTELVSDEILDSLRDRRFQIFCSLLELLKPNEKLEYPANWYRSFNGKIVCPTSLSDWPDYERLTSLYHDVELRVFDVYEVENGVVQKSVRLDTSARESIELIKRIQDSRQKKWIKHLINFVALGIGYEENKFTKRDDEKSANNPMDFIFEVTEDQKVNIIYTRPRGIDIENLNNKSIAFEDIGFPVNSNAVEAGYYLIKAGKNAKSKKYAANPPLAIIKLKPQKQDYLVGTAFICGERSLHTGTSVVENINIKLDESPALEGSRINFDKKHLFNLIDLFVGRDKDYNYASKKATLIGEFTNDKNLLHHLTFIDDGNFVRRDDSNNSLSNKEGRVYTQTSLSVHSARLIDSK